jgi:hypothetical protein
MTAVTDAQITTIVSFVISFIVLVVCLNIWDKNRRACLTSDERAEEDETARALVITATPEMHAQHL